MNTLSKNLRELRQAAGLTQEGLAEKLFVTRQTISNWETGRSEPDLEALDALARALGTEVPELLWGKREPGYPTLQKNYIRGCFLLGGFLVLGVLLRLFLVPILSEYRRMTFDTIPFIIYRLGAEPLFSAAAGALLLCLLSLGLDLRPGKPWRIAALVLGIACLAPCLITAVQFLLMKMTGSGKLDLHFLFPPVRGILRGSSLALLPSFLGGGALFLGCNRRD